jgi:hypothetical protein
LNINVKNAALSLKCFINHLLTCRKLFAQNVIRQKIKNYFRLLVPADFHQADKAAKMETAGYPSNLLADVPQECAD